MVAKCIKHYTCGNFHVKLDEFISVPEYNKSIKEQKSFSCYYLGTDYNSKPTTQFDITQETFNDFFSILQGLAGIDSINKKSNQQSIV